MALTTKQQRFIEEYLVDFNATAAARRAGYSEHTANIIGTENLAKPYIAEAIREKIAALSKATEMTVSDLWKEWTCLAKSDIGEVMDFTGTDPKLRPANQIPESARRAIKSMKVKRQMEGSGDNAREVEVIEFQFWDKPGALSDVAKALGKLVERTEHTGKGGGPIEIEHSGNISNEPSITTRDALFAESLALAAADTTPDPGVYTNGRSQHLDNGCDPGHGGNS